MPVKISLYLMTESKTNCGYGIATEGTGEGDPLEEGTAPGVTLEIFASPPNIFCRFEIVHFAFTKGIEQLNINGEPLPPSPIRIPADTFLERLTIKSNRLPAEKVISNVVFEIKVTAQDSTP